MTHIRGFVTHISRFVTHIRRLCQSRFVTHKYLKKALSKQGLKAQFVTTSPEEWDSPDVVTLNPKP